MTKPLVALYKTYRGGEWFHLSLESIKNHCIGAVVVSSDRPWRGMNETKKSDSIEFPENCRSQLTKFKNQNPNFQVHEVFLTNRQNSNEQYTVGLSTLKAIFGINCGVLIIDTDEIWEPQDLDSLVNDMNSDKTSFYFCSKIWTYIRSPFWRVNPQENGKPVVGLMNADVPIGNSRFSGIGRHKIKYVQNCSYHHMGYVRVDHEEIMAKVANSSGQDGVSARLDWKEEVWEQLPKGMNIHPIDAWSSCWPGVAELTLKELPSVLTDSNEFWAMAGHHRGGIPVESLLSHDQAWRTKAEQSDNDISTWVQEEYSLCFSAAMQGNISQDNCIFLVPRLRMSFKEVCQLALHASNVPAGGSILEIGSGLGGSMAVIGSHVNNVRLYAVDPYVPYDEQNKTLSQNLEVGDVENFFRTVNQCDICVNLFKETSESTINSWENWVGGTLDMILVDGNHSYSHALFDLTAWWDKLKPGGTMLLHDLSGRFPGVIRAAQEFENKVGQKFNLPFMSSLAWMKKPA